MDIQLKRGNQTDFGTVTLIAGEPAFILDTGEVYIGDGTSNVLINPPALVDSVSGKIGAVTLAKADVGLGNVDNVSELDMFTDPILTGAPLAPTPLTSDSSTNIATTAYVKGQGYLTSVPVDSVAGRTGIVVLNKADVGLGNVDNVSELDMFTDPVFTGSPLAPTPLTSDSTTKIATTAFVKGQDYLTNTSGIDGGVF